MKARVIPKYKGFFAIFRKAPGNQGCQPFAMQGAHL